VGDEFKFGAGLAGGRTEAVAPIAGSSDSGSIFGRHLQRAESTSSLTAGFHDTHQGRDSSLADESTQKRKPSHGAIPLLSKRSLWATKTNENDGNEKKIVKARLGASNTGRQENLW
jgi:hypothetical protein